MNSIVSLLRFPMSMIPKPTRLILATLVLAFPFSVLADATLVFGNTEEGKAHATHQFHIKDGKVSIANANDKRLLIYDSATDTARVVDHEQKVVAELNRAAFEDMAAELIETQRLVLAEMEGKLRDLPKEKREELRRVMEVLHQSTNLDSVGPAKALRFEETGEVAEWLGKKVRRASVFSGDKKWGTALIGDGESVGLSPEDFSTTQSFNRFFDGITKGLPFAVGQLFGKSGLMTEEGLLIVKLDQEKSDDEPAESVGLLMIDHGSVESGWFEVPSDFQQTTIKPREPGVDSGEKTEAEAPEK